MRKRVWQWMGCVGLLLCASGGAWGDAASLETEKLRVTLTAQNDAIRLSLGATSGPTQLTLGEIEVHVEALRLSLAALPNIQTDTAAMRLSLNTVSAVQADTAATRLSLNGIPLIQTDTAAIRLSLNTVSAVQADTAAIRLSLNTVSAVQGDTAAIRLSLNTVSVIQADTAAMRLSLSYDPRPEQGTGRTYKTVVISNAAATTTDLTLTTVTGGKTYYVTGGFMTVKDASAEQANGILKDGTTGVIGFEYTGTAAGVTNTIPLAPGGVPIRFSTNIILWGSTANGKVSGYIVGYEE